MKAPVISLLAASIVLSLIAGCGQTESSRPPAGTSAAAKRSEIEANPHLSDDQKAAALRQMSAAAQQARAQAESMRPRH
jgi:hypothetical protein